MLAMNKNLPIRSPSPSSTAYVKFSTIAIKQYTFYKLSRIVNDTNLTGAYVKTEIPNIERLLSMMYSLCKRSFDIRPIKHVLGPVKVLVVDSRLDVPQPCCLSVCGQVLHSCFLLEIMPHLKPLQV